jgi:hypothetical protein
MKQCSMKNIDLLSVVKILIVVYIVFSVFFQFNTMLSFLDNKMSKIIMLLVILVVTYYDLHTGILLTVAFLILIIQFNASSLDIINHNKNLEFFSSSIPADYDKDEKDPEDVKKLKQQLECDNVKKNEISNDIFDYQIDNKVKPYEVFVKMLTTKDHLDNASNSALLQPEPEDLL